MNEKKNTKKDRKFGVFFHTDCPLTDLYLLIKVLIDSNILPFTKNTLHFKGKKLETNSTRKLQHVLDTINQNWYCPWSPFCCRGSLSPLKSTRWQRPWSKNHRIKKPTPLWKTNFLVLQLCALVPWWLVHFKRLKKAPCL